MTGLRIALAQFAFRVGAVRENVARIADMIAVARDEYGAQLVVFPELAVCGYPPEDLLLRPSFLRDCAEGIEAVARAATGGIVAVVGWPEAAGNVVYNAASVLRDGKVERTYRKRELPNYAVFDERRYFAAGSEACVVEIAGVRVGLLICEDVWHPQPVSASAAAGAELLLVINASPFERDKHAERGGMLRQRARESGCAVCYVNLVGGQDELVFDGGSTLVDADGRLHPPAEAFAEHWLQLRFAPAQRRFALEHWQAETQSDPAALAWRAIVRGIRDYAHGNGFGTVWVGLSGGIDSAMTLALAVDALGAEQVTAVRLPSRYTTALSNDLAEEQCRALGVKMLTVPIEKPFQGYLDALADAFAGQTVDVTEENLQSRCRGALLMALANKFGGLLLTTGNKSEYAVGYATIYGDMCGGYAPLKDLYKTEVYELSAWRNAQVRKPNPPVIPPLVMERPPSAELRENQVDQDSLPPYETLDAILRLWVDNERSQADIVASGFDSDTVTRVVRLVCNSEWKRRQAAPGPKVSRRAFGRERRYPITNRWR